ncbi:hypothetical protein Tco_0347300, partial [Tanacetum coccineum]
MAKQAQTLFLEEWLKTNSGAISNSNSTQSTPQSARAIIQAWANLREPLQQKSFTQQHYQSLQTLINSGISLYVADPQVKLILSILSAPDISLPSESYPPFLRLLYIWSALFFTKGLLLLGAFTFVPSISEETRTRCLELFCKLFGEDYKLVSVFDDLVPSVLAGIGYALSSLGSIHFVRILDLLFGVWNRKGGPSSSLSHGVMLLHLVEWVLYNCIQSQSSEKVSAFTKQILEAPDTHYASFSFVMGAAGALRASSRSMSTGLVQLRSSAEQRLEITAGAFISNTRNFTDPNDELKDRVLIQCISLALARSGPVSSKDSLLLCLASAIFTEIIPLRRFYSKILGVFVNSSSSGLYEVKEHLNSVIFKEAGVITG